MSDLHRLPLRGHDIQLPPRVRARVFRAGHQWYWRYTTSVLYHGPFASWDEAYASARNMTEML